jgi:hypothetical protein
VTESTVTRLPVPAGTSPFHIKGLSYRNVIARYAQAVPGGIAAIQARCEDETLARFIAQPFLAGSWYDVLPFVPLTEIAAQLRGLPYDQTVRGGARIQAEQDVHGIHKVLLRLASPDMLSSRIPRLVGQYTDFCKVTLERSERGRRVGTLANIPEMLTRWYAAVSSGYLDFALGASGARDVTVTYERLPAGGSVAGIRTCELRFTIRWQA